MRRKAIIGALVSVFFLWLALRKVDYSELGDILQSCRWEYLIPNLVLVIGVMFLRAWRWGLILRPVGKVPYARVYSSTMIGFMVNNILPARLGEIARAVSLGMKTGVSRSAVLATIIVERVYDSLTLLIFLWLVFAFSRITELTDVGRIQYLGWLFLLVTIGLSLLLALLQYRNEQVVRFIALLTRPFSEKLQAQAREVTSKFAQGLRIHHNWSTTLGIATSSLLLWFVMGISNYFIFLALGFDHLPWEASFVVLVVVSLMISIPSTAGYVGVFHWATQVSLAVYGLQESEGLAVAIVLHAAQYIPITLLGLYFLRREHFRLSDVGESSDEPILSPDETSGNPARQP